MDTSEWTTVYAYNGDMTQYNLNSNTYADASVNASYSTKHPSMFTFFGLPCGVNTLVETIHPRV